MTKTIVFLCSGNGGNLRFVHKAINEHWISRWSKIVVIADRYECPALKYACRENLDYFILDFREPNQIALTKLMMSIKPDLVITTVHHILCEPFLREFENPLLNLHYSLLPSFSGLIGVKPIEKALEYGSRLIGVTVHHVTETVDSGRPWVQIALPINQGAGTEDLMDTIFRAGCFALLTALKTIENPRLNSLICRHIFIKGSPALINPSVEYPSELYSESFWVALRS